MEQEYYFKEGCYITEIYNIQDDPGVSIAKVRVKPGEITRWHSLKGTTERYLIIDGTGIAEKNNDLSKILKAGNSWIILPGEKQRIKNIGSDDLIFYAICTPRFVEENYSDCEDE
jgi:quercetin dioxygenase-like cupin family protein